MKIEFILRPCTKEDYDFCYKLSKKNMTPYVDKHWDGWEDSFFTRNYQEERSRIIEINNEKIGFFEIEIKNELGIVHGIQIISSFIGKGIGTSIMSLIEKEFKEKGVKKIKLRVFIDNPAIRLYSRLGYKEVGKSNSKGTILMEKEI